MALKLVNRVKESTSTSGSGTITLNGASDGYQAFSSALSNGDTTYYTVVDSNSWEVGIGTYNSNTLSRDTILSSSNSNNKINLSGAGSVFIAYPAEKSIYKDAGNQVVIGSSGIIVESGIPSNINNVLYNVGNTLYFNGVPLTPSISGGYGIGVTNNSGNYSIYSTLATVNEAYSLVTTVFNRTSNPIPKFTAVYISGGQGDLPVIRPAIANGESTSSKTFGITQDVIASMDSGRVVSYGNITSLDTDQYNPSAPHGDINGRVLYLSPSVSGGLTLTKPYAPDHIVALGTVIRTHQNEGIFNVRVQNGFELEELHNVATTGAISGQFLKYNGSLWGNTNLLSSDIGDFASAVSGISPNISISGTSGISVDKNGNNYTIYTTGTFGLNSSQIQSLLNSGVSIYVVSGTGNFSSLSVGGTGVSVNGHTHVVSNITNFNSGVSGLLPSVSGSGYATVGFLNNAYTISITGLQPSGNYSLAGHTHTTSQITDFNSSVSGLLPVKDIVAGTNVTINALSGIYTINAISASGGGGSVVINNPADNRVLTSTGSTSGINAESNLTFDGSTLGVSGLLSATSGNFINNLQLNGVNVSLSGHTHLASSITNFNSAVSGLLPLVSGSGYVQVVFSNNNYTINTTGLQPSGNYSLVGHTHLSSDITNFNSSVSGLLAPYALLSSGNFTNLYVAGTPVSLSGHTHTASQITNFNSSVSGLLPSVSGSGFTTVTFANNVYRVGVTGLQPSGNYSLIGHTHTASDITDFNSATSGLIPVKNINGSGYVIVSSSGGIFTVGVTGLQPSGNYSVSGHTHLSSQITDFNSSVSGLLPVKDILAGTNITVSSISGVYTINATSGTGGGGVTISNPADNRVLTSTGSASGINSESNLTFDGSTLIVSGLITANSGNFTNTLQVNGVGVSLSGHAHLTSDITNFNSSVSGLLPSVSGAGYIVSSFANNRYTITATGLQPSGNYSFVGHSHLASDITNFNTATSGLLSPYALLNSGNFSNLYVNGIPVSVSGHNHTSSQIADFNSSVSGLINVKGIVGSGYISVTSSFGNFTIGVTGLQPSGNYTLVGHTHVVNDITNFNSSVSGLLSPYALLSSGNFSNLYVVGTPVSISGHTHTTSQIINLNSSVSGLLPSVSGSGYASVGFSNNIYTVSITGLQPSGNYSIVGHTHTASDITNFNNAVSGLLSPYALLSSGNFNYLAVNGVPVSTGTGGGGGGANITNPGIDRVLLSDGTSDGIIAQTGLTFDGNSLFINGVNSRNGQNLYMWANFR